ncbi:MAG: TorF family putative porin, partial [Caulobacteraceae bacterium]
NFTYAVNAGVASDYVFRGVDQTHGGVEGFGGVDLSYRQFYAGAWTSNVDFSAFGDRRTYDETDAYAGWRPSFQGFDLDLGAIYYGYLGQPGNVDYAEAYLKVGRSIGPLSGSAAIYASPNYPGAANGGYYAEGKAAYAITPKLSLSGAVGHKQVDPSRADAGCANETCLSANGATYTTWNLGAAYAVTGHVTVDLRYWDTDEHAFGSAFSDKLVISARAAFP